MLYPLLAILNALFLVPKPVLVKSFVLGHPHEVRVTAKVFYKRNPESISGAGEYSVVFVLESKKKPRQKFTFGDIGDGVPSYSIMKSMDMIGAGRKQFFISVHYQFTTGFIFDCDGTKVRKLYILPHPRAFAEIVRRKGRWKIKETWSEWHWKGEGLPGKVIKKRNMVIRWLHWNGREFVPDR